MIAPEEVDVMSDSHADALVFFGATGDLAFKKIFPALQAMVKRGHLAVPVIGVARSGDLEKLRARARESVEQHAGRRWADPSAGRTVGRPPRYPPPARHPPRRRQ